MGIPDEWSSIVFGRGQNPAYRPSGFFLSVAYLGSRCRGNDGYVFTHAFYIVIPAKAGTQFFVCGK